MKYDITDKRMVILSLNLVAMLYPLSITYWELTQLQGQTSKSRDHHNHIPE